MTLSWLAGDNGGVQQTFVVLKAAPHRPLSKAGKVDDTGTTVTQYKVTDLEPNTTYNFSVSVYNAIGRKDCSHVSVSARTVGMLQLDKLVRLRPLLTP